jgi:hypothetical protein
LTGFARLFHSRPAAIVVASHERQERHRANNAYPGLIGAILERDRCMR